jgi:predicted nuclease of restriction endonuclease-like RecB superfamily
MPSQKVPSPCPQCGKVRYLIPRDAKRTKRCQTCHCNDIAPLGARATLAKYGEDFLVKMQAEKGREKPSSLEQKVIQVLNASRIVFRHQVILHDGSQHWIADFKFTRRGIDFYIEVNGTYIHKTYHEEKDKRKLAFLQTLGPVLVLWDEDFAGDFEAHLMKKIKEFIWLGKHYGNTDYILASG